MENAFVWAQGNAANIQEPEESLKQKGWTAGSKPAASNFNWMFKTITENVAILNKDISLLQNSLNELKNYLDNELVSVKTHVDLIGTTATDDLTAIKKEMSTALSKAKEECFAFIKSESSALNAGTKALQSNLEEQKGVLKDVTEFGKATQKSHERLCTSLSTKLMRLLQNLTKMEIALIKCDVGYDKTQTWPNFGVLPRHLEENGDE